MARILVIDDVKEEREVLTELLKDAPHQVSCAPDGKAALELLRHQPAELVITDMIMPGMDGIETIVALRQKYPDVKIIAMSGGGVAGFDKYLHLVRNLGVHKFVTKPYTADEMPGAVRDLLGPS